MNAPSALAAECACGCGRDASSHRRGWSEACYFRWYRAGRPDTGPPPTRKGKDVAAARKEDIAWLAENGTSHEEIAQRLGISVQTVLRHLNADAAPPTCAVDGCQDDAAHYRWCERHHDPQQAYREARAAGLNRGQAAQHVGVNPRSTYRWEPGEPGQGRPRKQSGIARGRARQLTDCANELREALALEAACNPE